MDAWKWEGMGKRLERLGGEGWGGGVDQGGYGGAFPTLIYQTGTTQSCASEVVGTGPNRTHQDSRGLHWGKEKCSLTLKRPP